MHTGYTFILWAYQHTPSSFELGTSLELVKCRLCIWRLDFTSHFLRNLTHNICHGLSLPCYDLNYIKFLLFESIVILMMQTFGWLWLHGLDACWSLETFMNLHLFFCLKLYKSIHMILLNFDCILLDEVLTFSVLIPDVECYRSYCCKYHHHLSSLNGITYVYYYLLSLLSSSLIVIILLWAV